MAGPGPAGSDASSSIFGSDSTRTVCLARLDARLSPLSRESFLRGLRRAFAESTLATESWRAAGGSRRAGPIRNRFRLRRGVCDTLRYDYGTTSDRVEVAVLDQGVLDLPIRFVFADSGSGRQSFDLELHIGTGKGGNWPMVDRAPFTIDVLGRRPVMPTEMEGLGWRAGLAALQALHRRAGSLPDSLDLAVVGRGRKR